MDWSSITWEQVSAVLAALLALSEALGLTKRVQASSLLGLVVQALRKLAGK